MLQGFPTARRSLKQKTYPPAAKKQPPSMDDIKEFLNSKMGGRKTILMPLKQEADGQTAVVMIFDDKYQADLRLAYM